jgi:hypothetical protein
VTEAATDAVASPIPWGLWAVCAMGAVSAMAWGLSTLFRPRIHLTRPDGDVDADSDPDEPGASPPAR